MDSRIDEKMSETLQAIYDDPEQLIELPAGTLLADPPHPGEHLRGILDDLEITVTEAALALNVSRNSVSELVNEKRSVSVEMAERLARVFGFTRDMWMAFQTAYDVWHFDPSAVTVRRSYVDA